MFSYVGGGLHSELPAQFKQLPKLFGSERIQTCIYKARDEISKGSISRNRFLNAYLEQAAAGGYEKQSQREAARNDQRSYTQCDVSQRIGSLLFGLVEHLRVFKSVTGQPFHFRVVGGYFFSVFRR